MPISFRSYLIPETWLTESEKQDFIAAAEMAALESAQKELGDLDYVSRALVPTDFNAVTVEEWLETTGTSVDDYVTSALADGSSIRDNTFIGIYGVQWLTAENEAGVPWGAADVTPPVSAVRITIGGTRVVQWDLTIGLVAVAQTAGVATTSADAVAYAPYPALFAMSPVVITQNKPVTISYWETVASVDFQIKYLGVVIEPRGSARGGLNP